MSNINLSPLWTHFDELTKDSPFNHSTRIAGLSIFSSKDVVISTDKAILLCANTESDLNISLHTRFITNPPPLTCLDDVFIEAHLFNTSWGFSTDPRIVFAAISHDLVPASIRLLHQCGRSIDFIEPILLNDSNAS